MRIKDGVRFSSPEMAMLLASMVVAKVFDEYDVALTLTGGCEGRRQVVPHGFGGALDFRLNHVTISMAEAITEEVDRRLGDGFDAVDHGEGDNYHLHVEYDPKETT